ncbi:MAG: hypothetical protein HKN49_01080 [Gammaproteobacteria bacterium]|nr:hypothetical protein [Gammaproteobacteria bacterium]
MKKQHQNYQLNRVAGIVGMTGMALVLAMFFSSAFALEPVEENVDTSEATLTEAMMRAPRLANTGDLAALRAEVRNRPVAAAKPSSTDEAIEMRSSSTPQVIEEAIDLECLPLLKLSPDKADKKVYFGISFDGTVGIHGKI